MPKQNPYNYRKIKGLPVTTDNHNEVTCQVVLPPLIECHNSLPDLSAKMCRGDDLLFQLDDFHLLRLVSQAGSHTRPVQPFKTSLTSCIQVLPPIYIIYIYIYIIYIYTHLYLYLRLYLNLYLYLYLHLHSMSICLFTY